VALSEVGRGNNFICLGPSKSHNPTPIPILFHLNNLKNGHSMILTKRDYNVEMLKGGNFIKTGHSVILTKRDYNVEMFRGGNFIL
jgi:hypothetical protein